VTVTWAADTARGMAMANTTSDSFVLIVASYRKTPPSRTASASI
jgi:hypothetical protein